MLEKYWFNRSRIKRTSRRNFVKSTSRCSNSRNWWLRKIRYAIGNKGKSGSIRVLYVDLVIHEKVYLITAYTKNQKDNLSNEEKAIVKKMIEQLKDEADRGGKK